MKMLIYLLLMVSLSASGQNVKRDSNGNYVTISPVKEKPVKTKYTYTDSKGIIYPVYQTSKGGRFVYKISKKTGKLYKMTLKE